MTDGANDSEAAHHRPEAAVPDRLGTARGILADIAQHSATQVRAACHVVLELSADQDEREDAQGLLRFITERREADQCAKS